MPRLLSEHFNIEQAIARTREVGYFFAAGAINPYFCALMEAEIGKLPLEEVDQF